MAYYNGMPVFTEEIEETLVVLARAIWTYFEELKKCGFDDAQALMLSLAYQQSIVSGMKGGTE